MTIDFTKPVQTRDGYKVRIIAQTPLSRSKSSPANDWV